MEKNKQLEFWINKRRANVLENYVAIGDIHGRFDLLMKLVSMINELDKPHRLVFLGDMVDRGPDSYKVVGFVKSQIEIGGAIALMGNHEHMMLDYYRKMVPNKQHIWLANGGHKTIESYGKPHGLYGHGSFFHTFGLTGHAKFIESLPFFYETKNVWFSHAPVPKVRPQALENQRDYRDDHHALIWSYEDRKNEGQWEMDHGKTAVAGHIHGLFENVLTPRIYDHIIYADTGCGCHPDAPLTGIIIEQGKFAGYRQAFPDGTLREARVA